MKLWIVGVAFSLAGCGSGTMVAGSGTTSAASEATTPTTAADPCDVPTPTVHAGQTVAPDMTFPTVPASCSMPGDELERIQAAIGAEPGDGTLISVSVTPDRSAVEVHLRADGLERARALHDTYGDKVRIVLGRFAFPKGSALSEVPAGPCAALPQPTLDDRGLSLSVELASSSVRSGADGHATLHVHNATADSISFEGERPLVGVVQRVSGGVPVAGFTGVIVGTGLLGAIPPGGEFTVDVIFGTATCDETFGYALPADTYQLVVPWAAHVTADRSPVTLLSPPVLFTVVP